jgi:aspartate/methionine/tyrosine aminotransferase
MTRERKADPAGLQGRRASLLQRLEDFKRRGLKLDMTRGKPSAEQLDLSAGLLTAVAAREHRAEDGTDCRNYGVLEGLPEARRLFAPLLDVRFEDVMVGGNSSLALMHDTIIQALVRPLPGAPQPWRALPSLKFLCPSPGYDRHFAICQHLGIDMQAVEMRADGPDMDAVEEIAASDPTVKGIWCVPKYSNPTGVTFSDSVVERMARMKTAASDFRVFWDNAYAIHPLTGAPDPLRNVMEACVQAGNANRPFVFGSTSKVTFAGAGVAMVAASPANLAFLKAGMAIQTIGPDKLNQLRHVRFFGDVEAIHAHMQKHAALLRPKFDAVQEILERELGGTTVADWSRPRGGYFVSLDVPDGSAKRVVAMANEAGVKLTAAGATFAYGHDPRDRNIRIAPSLPPLDEIRQAMELLAICVQLAAIENLSA